MNFRYASWLSTWWSTYPRFAYGLITSPGTRNPYPCESTVGGLTWS